MKLTLVQRRLAAFFLAYIGVIYELGYAQLLSATLGNTYFRYATTIGIFTLTLGIASLLQERRKVSMAKVQLLLFFIGILGAYWIRFFDPARFPFDQLANFLSYLPIILVGLLTGFELPLLLEQSEAAESSKVLAWDYLGMFVATIVFPMWLLPVLGVMWSLFTASILNFLAFLFFFKKPSCND